MDKIELREKIKKIIEADREDIERGRVYEIKDMVDDILMYVNNYIEEHSKI